jgi:hypothetical protein
MAVLLASSFEHTESENKSPAFFFVNYDGLASPRVPLGHTFFQEVVFIPPEYPGEQAAVELAYSSTY